LPLVPAYASIEKYNYPHTPLHAGLFRVRGGPFQKVDLTNGAFAQFADAKTLERYNTYFVSRDIHRALPGDLLFFRRAERDDRTVFHSMIFVGHSRIRSSSLMYVVYNTGPDGATKGEMRMLTVDQLLQFPQPEWRPYASNRQFLGVFRWNILRDPT
jgi:uncharacterized protein YfaT (DUF1175 family)